VSGLIRKFVAFSLVGTIATIIQYIVLIALVQLGGVDPVFASSVGFVTSSAVNYLLNYRVIFRSRKAHFDSGTKFLIISLLGLGLNTLTMYAGAQILGVHYFLTQLIATAMVLLWNFSGNYLWSFREDKKTDSRTPL
jgi:putative flippase GtrA